MPFSHLLKFYDQIMIRHFRAIQVVCERRVCDMMALMSHVPCISQLSNHIDRSAVINSYVAHVAHCAGWSHS